MNEAHVEHAIGFVEDEKLDLVAAVRALPRTRSSRRPGVATRTSTPFIIARTCLPIGTPPIASVALTLMLRP